jgi:Zn finger protein HypA/HybF involved in hydrogenase expression
MAEAQELRCPVCGSAEVCILARSKREISQARPAPLWCDDCGRVIRERDAQMGWAKIVQPK